MLLSVYSLRLNNSLMNYAMLSVNFFISTKAKAYTWNYWIRTFSQYLNNTFFYLFHYTCLSAPAGKSVVGAPITLWLGDMLQHMNNIRGKNRGRFTDNLFFPFTFSPLPVVSQPTQLTWDLLPSSVSTLSGSWNSCAWSGAGLAEGEGRLGTKYANIPCVRLWPGWAGIKCASDSYIQTKSYRDYENEIRNLLKYEYIFEPRERSIWLFIIRHSDQTSSQLLAEHMTYSTKFIHLAACFSRAQRYFTSILHLFLFAAAW